MNLIFQNNVNKEHAERVVSMFPKVETLIKMNIQVTTPAILQINSRIMVIYLSKN